MMFRALVNRRPAGDFPQRIALPSDSHPHVVMHAEAMDDGPILICYDGSASAEQASALRSLGKTGSRPWPPRGTSPTRVVAVGVGSAERRCVDVTGQPKAGSDLLVAIKSGNDDPDLDGS
jgi:hypothetical protein